ncbi:hypothetical protein ABGB18_35700 [Nonomuraea sp. B12E4]|uniref:hypothetical protein n=1 Tax=Nonomuraea sp. B12E4 TaxID=3153564 RepID=UPI00325C85BC
MITVMRMLVRGGSRRERVRGRLMISGAALATFLLCAAVTVLQVDDRVLGDFFTGDAQAVTALGMAILVVPVMAFVHQVSRLASATRERRLAALRLAGATPRHVRRLGAYEGGWRALLGGLSGIAGYLVVALVLSWSLGGGLPLISYVQGVTVLIAVTLAGALSGTKAGGHVVSSPLGVVRRAEPAGPRARDLVLVVVGIGAYALGIADKGRFMIGGVYGVALLVVAGAVLLLFGLVLATAWLVRAAARQAGRRAATAESLLAARLMEADPRGWARALSVVGLTVFFSSAVGAQQAPIILEHGYDTDHMTAYLLIDLALLVALATSAAALIVHQAEELLDHRQSFAVLAASGAPVAALGRVLVRQAVTAAVPVCLVTALAGPAVVILSVPDIYRDHLDALGWVAARAVATAAIGVLTAVLVARAARPLLRRALDPDELRTE